MSGKEDDLICQGAFCPSSALPRLCSHILLVEPGGGLVFLRDLLEALKVYRLFAWIALHAS